MSDPASDEDLQLLQGTWRQVAFEADGVVDPPDDHGAPDSLTTIVGNRYTVHTAEGDLILQGMLQVDATLTPKCILWTDDVGPEHARTLVCSYRLDAGHFVFIGALAGHPRPTRFATMPGQQMRTFVRCS